MKDLFIKIYKKNIKREGAEKLLDWINNTDFFTAPASTKYHLNHEGGLCVHSIHVFDRLLQIVEGEGKLKMTPKVVESIAICGLLHDICKANFYKVEMRNTKNESGQWIKVPYYTVDDQLPYGHGEKSVYIISGFMNLTGDEAIAIRWHMGGFDDSVKGGSYSMGKAFQEYPLAVMLHIADLLATFLDETETEGDNIYRIQGA